MWLIREVENVESAGFSDQEKSENFVDFSEYPNFRQKNLHEIGIHF